MWAPLSGMSDPLNKDTNKISHIILMILRKIFCDINGKVENLRSLTDNKYTIKMVYQNFKEKMLLIICELWLFERRGGLYKKKNAIKTEIVKSLTEKNQVVAPVFLQHENSNIIGK